MTSETGLGRRWSAVVSSLLPSSFFLLCKRVGSMAVRTGLLTELVKMDAGAIGVVFHHSGLTFRYQILGSRSAGHKPRQMGTASTWISFESSYSISALEPLL